MATGSLLGRPPRAAASRSSSAAPQLMPDSILRSIVLVQAGFRRHLVEDAVELLGIRPTMPAPPVAVALFFCRRALRPESVDVVPEATILAAMICGREHDLTLGPIVAAYEQYVPKLPAGDPILEMLQERFGEVLVDVEEDLRRRLSTAEWPSEARQRIDEVASAWGAPSTRLGGEAGGPPLFAEATAGALKQLEARAEEHLTAQLPACKTIAGLDAIHEAVERELGHFPNSLRPRVRKARAAYREHIDLTVKSAFGWPPIGRLPALATAGRWYTHEMGEDHPVVEDFIAATKRSKRKVEKEALEELVPLAKSISELQKQLNTDPAPPRLIAEHLEDEFREKSEAAAAVFERSWEDLGSESSAILRLARTALLPRPFLARMAKEAEDAALILRQPTPPACPGCSAGQAEERLAAAVRVSQLLGFLEQGGDPLALALRCELHSELEWAAPFAAILEMPERGSDVGGLEPNIRSRGLDPSSTFSQEPMPNAWAPIDMPTTLLTARTEDDGIQVNMKLHGVEVEDVQHMCEILLQEKLAAVIAQECGIPREWITHLAIRAPPLPPVAEAVLQGETDCDTARSFAPEEPGTLLSI